jgi:hypothetical protein
MRVKVVTSAFTVAEYCAQLDVGNILVNKDYQRSPKAWPAAARSYLIDTILLGFPIPKFSLYQRTDLRSRATIKEIVDGQQRSMAIRAFLNDELRISGRSEFSGRVFSDLDEPDQQRFIEYQLNADVFVSATPADIRQTFRRINSYTVPLNYEEHRHATHQGEFKWFIVELTETYGSILKELGVFSERNLARMADARLLTEFCLAVDEGIKTYSKTRLDSIYTRYDVAFAEAAAYKKRIEWAVEQIFEWAEIHSTKIIKPASFYSMLLALTHINKLVPTFESVIRRPQDAKLAPRDTIVSNLTALLDDLESDESTLAPTFAEAASSGTNTKKNRETRFQWMYRALTEAL